jgi:2-methylcitrate dehydratase PrpD
VRIQLQTLDGRELDVRVDHGRGTPANPATRDELVAKFRRAAGTRLPEATVERLLELLLNLEQVQDTREITALLRPPDR